MFSLFYNRHKHWLVYGTCSINLFTNIDNVKERKRLSYDLVWLIYNTRGSRQIVTNFVLIYYESIIKVNSQILWDQKGKKLKRRKKENMKNIKNKKSINSIYIFIFLYQLLSIPMKKLDLIKK